MSAKESTPLLVNGAPAQTSATSSDAAGAVAAVNGSYGSSSEEGLPLPSASPEAGGYEATWLDRWLPLINDRPASYKLGSNLSAGVTVALINIPLSLALAVASDTSPQVGIIAAIWAPLFASLFGGSQYNIMGPTGALSGILARYAILWGPACLPVLALSSGALMLLVFAFHLDRFCQFLPSAVANGFTLGVAAIIAFGQLGAAFSLPPIPPSPHFLENTYAYFVELAHGLGDMRAFALCFVTWLVLFGLVKKFPKFPWMVPVAAVGIVLGWASSRGWLFPLRTLRDKYGELRLVLAVPPSFQASGIGRDWLDLGVASMSIAFVGVLETVISGRIADGMTRTSMLQRQEVFAVAIANVAAGAAGGLPATAALARTALNIRSGAASKLAGIFMALFTCLFALFLLPLFGYLPLCIVAALLFQVAAGMLEMKHLIHSWRIDRGSFWLTLFVGAMCLVFDPTAAIVLGAVGGLLRFAESAASGFSEVTLTRDLRTGTTLDLQHFDRHHEARQKEGMVIDTWRRIFGGGEQFAPIAASAGELQPSSFARHLPSHRNAVTQFDEHTLIYRFVGDLTYISAMHHMGRLRRMDTSKHVIISFRYCFYTDLDGIDALEECLLDLQRPEAGAARPRQVLLSGIQEGSMVHSLLAKCEWFERLRQEGRVFDTVAAASHFLTQQEQTTQGNGDATHLQLPSSSSTVAQRRLSMDDDLA